jgi:hypothetical protein
MPAPVVQQQHGPLLEMCTLMPPPRTLEMQSFGSLPHGVRQSPDPKPSLSVSWITLAIL